jgi:hypothetical protein
MIQNVRIAWLLSTQFYQFLSTGPSKCHKKKKHVAEKPKLNHPRVGIINSTSFPRRNPQGFNKSKQSNVNQKPLTSLPFYQSNYNSNAYRPAQQLKGFYQEDEFDESEEEAEEDYEKSDDEQEVEERVPKAPPQVKNPFDFPSLPSTGNLAKEEKEEVREIVEYESATEDEDEEYEEEYHSDEQQVVQVPKLLDDFIFRKSFPDVVTDPKYFIASPKLKTLSKPVYFEVHLTAVHSPSQFYFQYAFQTLFMLMNEMEQFYTKLSYADLVMSSENMKPGLLVAAKVLNFWHRAKIISPGDDGQVKVFLVDFGTTKSINMIDIRYLLKTFTSISVKALRGSIVGIAPRNGEWNRSTRKTFFDLTAKKQLFASIRSYCSADEVHVIDLKEKLISLTTISNTLNQMQVGNVKFEVVVESETFPFAVPM